jgi:hypothetical protein
MLVFAGRVKHALDVAVQRPHDTDAREQRWPVKFRDQQQRFHGGLSFVSSASCFGLGQFGDVRGGVTERDQRFPARHRDRIDKPLIPRHELHLPLIGDATRNMGSKHFSKILTSWTQSSC